MAENVLNTPSRQPTRDSPATWELGRGLYDLTKKRTLVIMVLRELFTLWKTQDLETGRKVWNLEYGVSV